MMEEKKNNSQDGIPLFWRKISRTWKIILAIMGSIVVIVNFLKLMLEIPIIPVWTAVWNNSSTFLHKLIDLRYAFAAQYNLPDLFVIPSLTFLWIFLGMVSGVTVFQLRRHWNHKPQKEHANAQGLRWQARVFAYKNVRRAIIITNVCFIFYTIGITYIMLDSYFRLCKFQRSCTMIRPFISDKEYYLLNRQWVTMTSKENYLSIEKQISEFNMRADLDTGEDYDQKNHEK